MSDNNPEIYFDKEGAVRRLRGRESTVMAMLKMFLADDSAEKLRKSLEDNDYSSAEMHAHSIKGLSGNLSLTQLFNISEKLDAELKHGAPNEETVNNFYSVMEKTIDTVKKTLAEYENSN